MTDPDSKMKTTLTTHPEIEIDIPVAIPTKKTVQIIRLLSPFLTREALSHNTPTH